MTMVHRPVDRETLTTERARLVRFCYRLTGSLDASEDLAQETLYEAVRSWHKLHDPSGCSRWLSAIARNVCMRWNEQKRRDASSLRLVSEAGDHALQEPKEDYDLEVELDRSELVELLDRALAMLPAESREVLVERFFHDLPHAEIAERLGLSAVAVRKRLERGKLRLKSVLSTALIADSISFGLTDCLFADWPETRIWCPGCGRQKLRGSFTAGRKLSLACTDCARHLGEPIIHGGNAGLFSGIKGFRTAHVRMLADFDRRYRQGVAHQALICRGCRATVPYKFERHTLLGTRYAAAVCGRCGAREAFVPHALLLSSTEGRKFWRDHPRVHALGERDITAAGVPAVVVAFKGMSGDDRIEGVFVKKTLERIVVHRAGVPPGVHF